MVTVGAMLPTTTAVEFEFVAPPLSVTVRVAVYVPSCA